MFEKAWALLTEDSPILNSATTCVPEKESHSPVWVSNYRKVLWDMGGKGEKVEQEEEDHNDYSGCLRKHEKN